jgi:hypothetical protein
MISVFSTGQSIRYFHGFWFLSGGSGFVFRMGVVGSVVSGLGCYCIYGDFVWWWSGGELLVTRVVDELLIWCVVDVDPKLVFLWYLDFLTVAKYLEIFLSHSLFPSLLRFAGLFVSGWQLLRWCWLFGGGMRSDCLGSLFTGIHQLLT